jgi:hypothetical protein
MKVVLFGRDIEIAYPFADRIGLVCYIYTVFSSVSARMGNPICSGKKLVFNTAAESIAHSAVITRDSRSAANRFKERFKETVPQIFLAHSPDWNK